jgi:hypothetical protein
VGKYSVPQCLGVSFGCLKRSQRKVHFGLEPVTARDEAQHRRKGRDREQDHADCQHRRYPRSQAAMKSSTTAAATSHPANDHGQTGASMNGLSRSMGRAYGRRA